MRAHSVAKRHKCQDVLEDLAICYAYNAEPPSSFVQCTPEQYRQEDPVEAYRAY